MRLMTTQTDFWQVWGGHTRQMVLEVNLRKLPGSGWEFQMTSKTQFRSFLNRHRPHHLPFFQIDVIGKGGVTILTRDGGVRGRLMLLVLFRMTFGARLLRGMAKRLLLLLRHIVGAVVAVFSEGVGDQKRARQKKTEARHRQQNQCAKVVLGVPHMVSDFMTTLGTVYMICITHLGNVYLPFWEAR